jgi:hypothetical protein
MSYVERHTVEVTTATGGGGTGYTSVLTGQVANIIYTADGTAPYASTADFTITAESSGLGLWTESNVTASKTVAPHQPTHNQSGVVQNTAGDVQSAPCFVANERVKIVIAQGGNTKTGSFVVVVA